MEKTGFEPVTFCVQSKHSTNWDIFPNKKNGVEKGLEPLPLDDETNEQPIALLYKVFK